MDTGPSNAQRMICHDSTLTCHKAVDYQEWAHLSQFWKEQKNAVTAVKFVVLRVSRWLNQSANLMIVMATFRQSEVDEGKFEEPDGCAYSKPTLLKYVDNFNEAENLADHS